MLVCSMARKRSLGHVAQLAAARAASNARWARGDQISASTVTQSTVEEQQLVVESDAQVVIALPRQVLLLIGPGQLVV